MPVTCLRDWNWRLEQSWKTHAGGLEHATTLLFQVLERLVPGDFGAYSSAVFTCKDLNFPKKWQDSRINIGGISQCGVKLQVILARDEEVLGLPPCSLAYAFTRSHHLFPSLIRLYSYVLSYLVSHRPISWLACHSLALTHSLTRWPALPISLSGQKQISMLLHGCSPRRCMVAPHARISSFQRQRCYDNGCGSCMFINIEIG